MLAGELPSTIANSFKAPPTRSYSRLEGNLTGEVDPETARAPAWLPQGSGVSVQPSHRDMTNGGDDIEAGERTGLLSANDKEERRAKLAKLALNGQHSSQFRDGHGPDECFACG